MGNLYLPDSVTGKKTTNIGNVYVDNTSALKEVNIAAGAGSMKVGKSVSAMNRAARGRDGRVNWTKICIHNQRTAGKKQKMHLEM